MKLNFYNDPSHWQRRANEMRRFSEHMKHAEIKARMLELAQEYDAMAKGSADALGDQVGHMRS